MSPEHLLPIMVGKKKAAELTGLSVRTLEYLISQKRLMVRKIGRRTLIPYRALQGLARGDTPRIEKTNNRCANRM
jgi:excisionase family DNA binding protein